MAFRARLSSFLVGAATGSAIYYIVGRSMLNSVSKADKRALEIREELVGLVATPMNLGREKALSALMAPLKPIQNMWSSVLSQIPSFSNKTQNPEAADSAASRKESK